MLGGVTIPHERGLAGHSDADALVHAIMDAVLGAMAMGDIGRHFPDSNPRYKGIYSMELLKKCVELMRRENWRLNNLDATIVAQRPKLSPYLEAMKKNLSLAFGAKMDCINLKATTEENLGFTGREEGIAAHCVCTLLRAGE